MSTSTLIIHPTDPENNVHLTCSSRFPTESKPHTIWKINKTCWHEFKTFATNLFFRAFITAGKLVTDALEKSETGSAKSRFRFDYFLKKLLTSY